MPLGQGIAEMWTAVRDRVEVSGHGPTWRITAGSFDSALAYAAKRFEDPYVLDRSDRARWWPRVTLTVTTDPALAASAPPLEELAHPPVPVQPTATSAPDVGSEASAEPAGGVDEEPPSALEEIFAHQEELRIARQRTPDHDTDPVRR